MTAVNSQLQVHSATHDTAGQRLADCNPFSTKFIRPGAIEYLFSDGETIASLLEQLQEADWRGEIVGPHGSGKTTLVHAIMRELTRIGKETLLVTIRDRTAGRATLSETLHQHSGALLIVDGFEQLDWLTRKRLPRRCRRAGLGLLVVTHRSVGLPQLYRTRMSQRLAERVVERLVDGVAEVSAANIRQARSQHGDNLRETLFTLYDLVEHAPNG